MKQIWPDYSYSPATNVLTLTGLNIDRDQLLLVAAPERGRIIYNFADSSVTASAFTSGANTALTLVASTAGLTTTASLVIYYDDQLQSTAVSISNFPATQPVSIASVTVGNTVTIAGTVTANLDPNASVIASQVENGIAGYAADLANDPLPISGTVTIGSALPAGTNRIGVVTIGAGTVTLGAGTAQIGSVTVGNSVTIGSLPSISGVVTAKMQGIFSGNYLDVAVNDQGYLAVIVDNQISISELPALASGTNQIGSVTVGNSVTIGSLPAISGTVTANSSNGSLTTRFGSVTTANTAFATSAVTNSNRKYLLIQNITTASNVITVGVGFTPTTTQGIQLIAGAGITFEGNYIPTGAVNLLSSVTASCFTILEA